MLCHHVIPLHCRRNMSCTASHQALAFLLLAAIICMKKPVYYWNILCKSIACMFCFICIFHITCMLAYVELHVDQNFSHTEIQSNSFVLNGVSMLSFFFYIWFFLPIQFVHKRQCGNYDLYWKYNTYSGGKKCHNVWIFYLIWALTALIGEL